MQGAKDPSPKWEMNEDIVISGISGRFAESDNIDELAKNLFDNVDMITEDDRRWPLGKFTSFLTSDSIASFSSPYLIISFPGVRSLRFADKIGQNQRS